MWELQKGRVAGRRDTLQQAMIAWKLFLPPYTWYFSTTRPEGELEEHIQNHNLDSLRVAISEFSGKNGRACAHQRAHMKVSSFPGHPSTSALPAQMCSEPCRQHLLVLSVGKSSMYLWARQEHNFLFFYWIFDAIHVFRISHLGTKEYEPLEILDALWLPLLFIFFFLSSKGLIHLSHCFKIFISLIFGCTRSSFLWACFL